MSLHTSDPIAHRTSDSVSLYGISLAAATQAHSNLRSLNPTDALPSCVFILHRQLVQGWWTNTNQIILCAHTHPRDLKESTTLYTCGYWGSIRDYLVNERQIDVVRQHMSPGLLNNRDKGKQLGLYTYYVGALSASLTNAQGIYSTANSRSPAASQVWNGLRRHGLLTGWNPTEPRSLTNKEIHHLETQISYAVPDMRKADAGRVVDVKISPNIKEGSVIPNISLDHPDILLTETVLNLGTTIWISPKVQERLDYVGISAALRLPSFELLETVRDSDLPIMLEYLEALCTMPSPEGRVVRPDAIEYLEELIMKTEEKGPRFGWVKPRGIKAVTNQYWVQGPPATLHPATLHSEDYLGQGALKRFAQGMLQQAEEAQPLPRHNSRRAISTAANMTLLPPLTAEEQQALDEAFEDLD